MANTIEKKEVTVESYLKRAKVYLRPIPDKSFTLIKSDDPNNIHKFMMDGAEVSYCLPTDRNLNLIDPFKGDKDMLEAFQKATGKNLDVRKPDNNWWFTKESFVNVTVDSTLISSGLAFNMDNVYDHLKVLMLRVQDEIAPTFSQRKDKPHNRFMLVDSDIEDDTTKKETDALVEIYMHFGELKTSKEKMKDFLTLYYMTYKEFKTVSEDMSEIALTNEIKSIIDRNKERYLALVKDPDTEIKRLIMKAVKIGSIIKDGTNKYKISGNDLYYNFEELIERLKDGKEIGDDEFIKISDRVKRVYVDKNN